MNLHDAIATRRSVRDFLDLAFARAGLDWQKFVVQDPQFLRPAEVDQLLGDSSKAQRILGWRPEVDFKGLVHMMVDADLKTLKEQCK